MHEDLQVFRRAEHPSFLVQNFEFKEGFSLFNMYDFTVTAEGRAFLKDLMSRPLVDLELINMRQTHVETFFEAICRHGKPLYAEM